MRGSPSAQRTQNQSKTQIAETKKKKQKKYLGAGGNIFILFFSLHIKSREKSRNNETQFILIVNAAIYAQNYVITTSKRKIIISHVVSPTVQEKNLTHYTTLNLLAYKKKCCGDEASRKMGGNERLCVSASNSRHTVYIALKTHSE